MPSHEAQGTLSDEQIDAYCKDGLLIQKHYSQECIKQACYELRCGDIYYDLSDKNKRIQLQPSEHILLKPHQMIAVITLESLNLPANILGRILTKGMLFSIGILPVNTYADPGFVGNLGIVLYNLSNNYLRLAQGMQIAKIEFSQLQKKIRIPYHGQHGYQTGLWPRRDDLIVKFEEISKDCRVGSVNEELERAFGPDFAAVAKRVFQYEKRLLLFMVVYFILTLSLIAILAGPGWIGVTTALGVGIVANVITAVVIHYALDVRRK